LASLGSTISLFSLFVFFANLYWTLQPKKQNQYNIPNDYWSYTLFSLELH
jgi:hypothetical protein